MGSILYTPQALAKYYVSLHTWLLRNTSDNASAVKTHMTVLEMRITCKEECDRNVCELYW